MLNQYTDNSGYLLIKQSELEDEDLIYIVKVLIELSESNLDKASRTLLNDALIEKYLGYQKVKWLSVKEISENMGYNLDSSQLIKLGRYVSKLWTRDVKRKESRQVGDAERNVWVYPDVKEVESLVNQFINTLIP